MILNVKWTSNIGDRCCAACIKMILNYCDIGDLGVVSIYNRARKTTEEDNGMWLGEVKNYLHDKKINCIRINLKRNEKRMNMIKYYIRKYHMPIITFTYEHAQLIVGYKDSNWIYIRDPNKKKIRRKSIKWLKKVTTLYATKVGRI